MLTASEKDALYKLITATIGDDISIKQYKNQFNERTVDAVEKMMTASAQCNSNMQDLIIDLVGSGQILAKGWLRKALKFAKKRIQGMNFHGYACYVGVKSSWRQEIISTTYF